MIIKTINDITIVKSQEIVIKDVQSALDFIMTYIHSNNCRKIAINKEAVTEEFFVANENDAIRVLSK